MMLHSKLHLPVVVEKDEDGFCVVECPILKGCYTQGETLDKALKNIHEVIEMCLEEEDEYTISEIATSMRGRCLAQRSFH